MSRQLTEWLEGIAPHLELQACARAATAALAAGRTVAALRCTSCAALHLDEDVFATRKHILHLCASCGAKFRHSPAVQGNPLGALDPVLRGGRLFLSRLPTTSDRDPPLECIMTLTVEPTFLGLLANHIRDTTDPAIVGLKSRAGSIDSGFRFVVVGG